MRILLGSLNPSKKHAVEKALKKLEISDYEIITYDAQPQVNSKPIGYEIIRGAENRNAELKKFARDNNLEYDYLISIEGGFSLDEVGLPFVVTYAIAENADGQKYTGKSLGISLDNITFDYIKNGGNLNAAVKSIKHIENNKQKAGLTGYLTNGLYNREDVDKDAVVSSLIPFIYSKEREALDEYIKEYNKKA